MQTMKEKSKKRLVQICGPTAVGKSKTAMRLAKRWNTVILSADSRQVYQEMDIGTAKPSLEDRKQVPHFFVDMLPLTAHVTAYDFENWGNAYLEEVWQEKDLAIVCGGTGLYLKALVSGMDQMPEIPRGIQQEVDALDSSGGLLALQEAIAKEDPEYFAKGESQNPARLRRALAVKRASGESILRFQTHSKKERPYEVLKIGLCLPKEDLDRQIKDRVDQMIEKGLIEEVQKLWPRQSLKSLQTVGYQEIFPYLEGKITQKEAIRLLIRNTRRYAKRQMTWFRKDPEIHWFSPRDPDLIAKIEALLAKMD